MSRIICLLKVDKKLFSGLMPMIFFSTAGHIIFLSLALILSALLPQGARTNGLEFRVSLSAFPFRPPGNPGHAARISAQKTETLPAPHAPVKKKEAIKITGSSQKNKNQEKKKAPEPEKSIETDQKSIEANPAKGSQASTGDQDAGISGSITGGSEGISIGGGSDFEYAWYRLTIMSKLKENWMRPVLQFSENEKLQCIVAFSIGRNGTVSNILIDTSSGYPALDRSAVRAVQDSAPFPPLPYQFTEEFLTARFIFELEPE